MDVVGLCESVLSFIYELGGVMNNFKYSVKKKI